VVGWGGGIEGLGEGSGRMLIVGFVCRSVAGRWKYAVSEDRFVAVISWIVIGG